MKIWSLFFGLTLVGCEAKSAAPITFKIPERDQFNKYWYNHGAEISRFDLSQSRYGELHKGHTVQIFVTEKFNSKLQVKADRPDKSSVPILKHNFYRRFYTGIYPYTAMTSTFSPLDLKQYPLPPKITSSVQEWCGQYYHQMNLKDENYSLQSRSYFESESDRDFSIPAHLPEEALYTMIRINPGRLPLGKTKIVPSAFYSRLAHVPTRIEEANATLGKTSGKSLEGGALVTYTLEFISLKRTLVITFERDFPFRIQSYTDTYPGIMKGKVLTTTAKRTHSLQTPYWEKHANKNRTLLKKLGLNEW